MTVCRVSVVILFLSYQCFTLPAVWRRCRWWRWSKGTRVSTFSLTSLEASRKQGIEKMLQSEIESDGSWTQKCWDVFLNDQCFCRPVVSLLQDNDSVFIINTVRSFQLVRLFFFKGENIINISFDETYDVNAMHHSLYGVYLLPAWQWMA